MSEAPHAHGTANRLRWHRVRAGRSAAGVAEALGIDAAWYADLERDDAELAATLNVFQALQLASILNVRLDELTGAPGRGRRVALVELPGVIRSHAGMQSVAELSAKLGWDVGGLLEAPVETAAAVPLALLQTLAAYVGADWRYLVPADDTAP
jgi:transcriptional regulator with XRE-family HTH domain